jgi:hypothetical protein
MIKEYNCHSDDRDLREVSGGGLGVAGKCRAWSIEATARLFSEARQ